MIFNQILRIFPRNFVQIREKYSTTSSKPDARQAELMAKSLPKRALLPHVQDIVIVASGKGGVGKSTCAANLAVSLAAQGKSVGLLDADIFGPSIPLMMNLSETPLVDDKNLMIPPLNYGVKCISMGLLVNQGPVVWRGPLVMSALQRLLKGTNWGPSLDVLIVDTPPGTGDVHLSLHQNVPVSGVVLVSTPQTAALEVTHRGAEMYKTLKVPIIGLVENMSHAVCDNCQHRVSLFGAKTQKFAENNKINILASIPLEKDVMECSDLGTPVSLKLPESHAAKEYQSLSHKVIEFLTNQPPKIN
ncbi:iron-sulfur cluster transfer protein Nubpl [Culicoides brevitarsis]|uniref:iron-sulfur cluster transfer protein Nubpl n=1 Tax=Culicoides brevitarsis TaxID=469753 RepID=UPI00307BABE4